MGKADQRPTDVQRAVSIEFIRNSGGYAVKANKGSKSPAQGWDPKLNDRQKSDILTNQLEHTDDNLGIHLHGPLVDVDIDSDAPYLMDAMETFLPSCSHVWGRTSRPRTHRIYLLKDDDTFDPGLYPLLKRLKRIDEVKVEVRGGPVTRGEYSLLPGSVHPDGDNYEWADLSRARSSISVTTIERLLYSIRLAGASAVLAPYWQEGIRNDLTMALAGFLHRAYSISENMPDGTFALDREASKAFLESFLGMVGDDSDDIYSRLKTFDKTWDKADKDVPVTGASTIAALTEDEDIVRKLYALLASSPDIAAIDEFVERFAIWQGPGLVVDIEAASKGAQRPIMTRQQFTNSYGHRFITVGEKRKLLADMLFSYSATQRIAGLTFEPGSGTMVDTREGTKINQWSGFAIPPYSGEVTEKDVEPFINYVHDVICSRDEETYEWFLGWLAHIFQEPANKAKTAVVLVGLPGVGKSLLGHLVLMPIIGDLHAATTNTVESVTKDFNVAFDNKIFVQCDEATNNRQRTIAARLKALVTDPYKLVEPKGVDAYQKPNHMRFIFTSNDVEDALYMNDGVDDRRYTVIEVSSKYKSAVVEYWEPLVEWLSDRENLARIHKYLLGVNYKRTTIQRPLITEAKITMQQRSWDPFDAWLAAWLARGHPLDEKIHDNWYDAPLSAADKRIDRSKWPPYVWPTALVRDYDYYCKHYTRAATVPMNESQISQALKKRGLLAPGEPSRIRVSEFDDKKGKQVIKRLRVYPVANPEQIRNYMAMKYGVTMLDEALDDMTESGDDEADDDFETEF